jgi:hypothetical protein
MENAFFSFAALSLFGAFPFLFIERHAPRTILFLFAAFCAAFPFDVLISRKEGKSMGRGSLINSNILILLVQSSVLSKEVKGKPSFTRGSPFRD